MSIPFFISGDWPFFFPEQISALPWAPSVYWVWANFGENVLARLWLDYPFRLIAKLFFTMGLSWVITEKLFIVGIALCAAWSMYRLSTLFLKEKWSPVAASVIYVFNTYFFLVLGGGQFGVAAAYALFPFVLLMWIGLLKSPSFRKALGTGVAFGLLTALDLRIAYLCILAFTIYSALAPWAFLSSIKYFVASFAVAASLHLYWLLPAALAGRIPLPQSATGAGSLSFFSVADFSHALTLLHPNWPENLFGRVYFQQPEFLIFPILAFAALLRVRSLIINRSSFITYFSFLALVGIFFAKGVNEPFGGIYEWLFTYVPGFLMFRDPTKFYIFIALSYAMLIPATLGAISRIRGVNRRIIMVGGVVVSLFLFRDVFLGKTTHSFQFAPIAKEYEILKDVLRADTRFSRVLWLPGVSHFAYSDDTHPFIDASHALQVSSPSAIVNTLQNPLAAELLSQKNIGYLVVPADEGKQMFLTDYTYDASLREMLIEGLGNGPFMRDPTFTDIAVYRNALSHGLFSVSDGTPVAWRRLGINTYSVDIPVGVESLTMHVSYDPGWRLTVSDYEAVPLETTSGWTRFELTERGGQARIYFAQDTAAQTGALISGAFFLLYCFLLIRPKIWKA